MKSSFFGFVDKERVYMNMLRGGFNSGNRLFRFFKRRQVNDVFKPR